MSQPGSARRTPLVVIGGIVLLVVIGLALFVLLRDEPEAARPGATPAPSGTVASRQLDPVVCSGQEALPYLEDFNAQMPELKTRARAIPGDQSPENFELQMLRTVELRDKVRANKVPRCLEGVQLTFLNAIDAVIEGYEMFSDIDTSNDQQGRQALERASDQLDELERELDAITIEE
jgi:hypothetical protein